MLRRFARQLKNNSQNPELTGNVNDRKGQTWLIFLRIYTPRLWELTVQNLIIPQKIAKQPAQMEQVDDNLKRIKGNFLSFFQEIAEEKKIFKQLFLAELSEVRSLMDRI